MSHGKVMTAMAADAPATVRALASQLIGSAAKYFGDVGRPIVHVRLVRLRTRPNSAIYEFVFELGAARHRAMVKVPSGEPHVGLHSGDDEPVVRDRPRLFPALDPHGKAQLEYAAMSRIQKHFENLHDSRFGVVRIYDFLPESRALVMEAVQHPSLSSLLIKKNRLQGPFSSCRLGVAFRNAGAWLRCYHELPGLEHTRTRHGRREDFLEAIGRFTCFLEPDEEPAGFFSAIRQDIVRAGAVSLPEHLPLVMGHGDFAPRNILVGPGGRVSVLDTLGRWRAPAFEDIGNFLLAFKAHRLQVYSQGLFLSASRIKQYENQFLRGYFGDDPIPLASIRLFECLAALEKWSSVVHGHGQSRGLRGLGKRCLSLAWARHLRRTMAQLIQEIRS